LSDNYLENNSGQDESHIRYPAGKQYENECFRLGLLDSDLLTILQTPMKFTNLSHSSLAFDG
ncbi:MAG: hypothetical protein ACW98G_11225, partial [Candidatus Hodarchaeales archaeon]|jgi:hypothetical protein